MFEPGIVKVSSTRFETKEETITYLGQKAGHTKRIKNVKSYVDVVPDRESTASTAVGFGIAVSRGESDAVTETFMACPHLLYPVQWDHDEADPVLMVGVPPSSRNKEYLRILTMLSRHLMKEAFRKELRKIGVDQGLYECIKFLEYENWGGEQSENCNGCRMYHRYYTHIRSAGSHRTEAQKVRL